MVRKPLTLFVLIASTGNRFFKAGADRHQTSSLQELSCRDRLQKPATQLLGNAAAVVCMAPIASLFRAQIVSQSEPMAATLTSFEIVQEAFVAIALMLLSAWLVKQVLTHWSQVVSPAGQPTKGACPAASSPYKGLNTSSRWGLWALLTYPCHFCRRKVQRRRLYLHAAVTRLENILPSLCGSSSRLCRPSERGSHGLHDWHEALPKGFLMPVEVAACRSPPEVRASLSRLLADRWWELDVPQLMLETVLEDECLVVDEPLVEEVWPDLPNEQETGPCF